ncbi:MAG: selenoneine biosynthesis selenosugar synthase SenB [Burkholderiales bacterium]
MRLVIVTPARPGTRHGNRATALRWARHLRALGHRVAIQVEWDGRDRDAMIALHARRSHASIAAWKRALPSRPVVLVLTGTDLYRDIRRDAAARASLDLADRLVVLQRKGLEELRAAHRARATVVHQSVHTPRRHQPPRTCFLATVIGHLREEKDPFCAARALAHLPPSGRFRILHLGGAMNAAAAREARRHMRADDRYRWLGELPHARAMRWLARSHLMVISSRMEGGAHVVSEAIAIGVPVLASRIPGNVGLLGENYPGYYPVGNERALAKLLARAQGDSAFLASLARKVSAQRAKVKPAAERRALRALLSHLKLR